MNALRNRPGGLAWIQIPAKYNGTGVEVLHGRHVTTVGLNSHGRWLIEPAQSFTAGPRGFSRSGRTFNEGERATVIAITDEQLIPVPDFDFRQEEGAEQDNLGVVGKVRA